MIQALHAILGDGPDDQKSDTEEVTLLYGSRNKRDILGGDMLQTWAGTHTEKFKHIDVLSHEPEDSDYKGERGFIDRLRSTCLQLALVLTLLYSCAGHQLCTNCFVGRGMKQRSQVF
jgi:NAD(P)H-flavin reductase